jgi:hypothetical protein
MSSQRPWPPSGAGLPPPAVRVRDVAGWQYALLAALWLGAIALVVWIGRGIPPAEAQAGGAGYHVRVLWPIVLAFVITLVILVRPRGALITHGPGPAPDAYSVVSGRVRDPAGREHAVAVTVPTVAGVADGTGVAREETLDLALAEARLEHPEAEWAAAPALREADPGESEAARAALLAWARRTPVPVATGPHSALRAVGLVLLGCGWVSLVAPAVVAVRVGYERVALAPPCRTYAAASGLAYRGARLRFGSDSWWDWNTRAGAVCLYHGSNGGGSVEVPLERVDGRARAWIRTLVGLLVVPAGGLGLWVVASAVPAAWLVRRWRVRRQASGDRAAPRVLG